MPSKLAYPQVWTLLISIIAADWAVSLLIPLCHRIGALDRPHTYKSHRAPMPFLGGVGVFIGFASAMFSVLVIPSFQENLPLVGILLGALLVTVMGCVDDFRPIPATVKLLILFGVTFLLTQFHVVLNLLSGIPALQVHVAPGLSVGALADMVLTLFWIAGVSSAMNSLDNMDGAALGISAIAAFFTFLIAWYSYQTQFSYVSIALCGACLGALRYNFKPARTFIGDNGSLLLGFLLSALMVVGGWAHEDRVKAVLLPCVVLVVPLFDITLATFLRYKNGVVRSMREAILYCGRDHLSHRLVALGLSQREAVLSLYLFGIAGGMIAYLLASDRAGPSVYGPVVGAGIVVLIGVGMLLDRAEVYGAGAAGQQAEGEGASAPAPPPDSPPPGAPGAET